MCVPYTGWFVPIYHLGLTTHLMGATDVSCHCPRAGPAGKSVSTVCIMILPRSGGVW